MTRRADRWSRALVVTVVVSFGVGVARESGAGRDAQQFVNGSERWTAISGNGGSYREVTGPTFRSPYNLTFGEQSDEPVEIRVMDYGLAARPPGGQYNTYAAQYLRLRSPNASSGEMIEVDGFIYKLQVCLNSDRTKLKGARIWGRRIESNGTLVASNSDTFERPNCRYWQPAVECGAGKLSSGVRAYYSGSGQDGFHGMALRCSTVD
jgi:hypothetical protein